MSTSAIWCPSQSSLVTLVLTWPGKRVWWSHWLEKSHWRRQMGKEDCQGEEERSYCSDTTCRADSYRDWSGASWASSFNRNGSRRYNGATGDNNNSGSWRGYIGCKGSSLPCYKKWRGISPLLGTSTLKNLLMLQKEEKKAPQSPEIRWGRW